MSAYGPFSRDGGQIASDSPTDIGTPNTKSALRKHIVGESEHLSKSVFECFSPWFAEELAA